MARRQLDFNTTPLEKAYRASGATYAHIATRTGLDESTVCRTILGRRKGPESVRRLAEYFGIPWAKVAPAWMLGAGATDPAEPGR